ncbi:MAG: SlyX family protein [Gammaproteobacteria bacterium]|nr:SlyX family protein [Gammaproteobacteria bacterium]
MSDGLSKSDREELETRIAFLDDSVQELTHTVARQENLINLLRNELNELTKQLRQSQSDIADLRDEAPPPHY